MFIKNKNMPIKNKFKKINENFIETGSYLGDGIQMALDSGFNNVFSIEITDKYHDVCRERFSKNEKVKLIKGDSYTELDNLLINNKDMLFTYWLDGHYSGGDTGFGILEFPIIEELNTILKRNVVGEIIYVDDMRILRNFNNEINENTIIETIKKYKPHANIYYNQSIHDIKDILIVEY
jgi:hypothetical protein